MKKLVFLLLLLFFGFCFSQVNIEQIKSDVTSDPKKFYYDNLEIFKSDPKSLSQEQLNYIYYGNNYVDYGFNRSEFNEVLNEVTKYKIVELGN
ncbi:hypothetical protein AB4Y90_01965 [Chryseobacterium sp. 2TAF14]|uniref:hypothetical protein n=1 Tax=Chryseobacterium sp. 2TAF14 TaxID=3233007 RepID=UPI003F92ED81